jgi:hypothetical protein
LQEAAKPQIPGTKKPVNNTVTNASPSNAASKRETGVPPPAEKQLKIIRAKRGLKGLHAMIQTRLMALFDNGAGLRA